MPEIATVNSVAWASLSAIGGVAKAAVGKIGGTIDAPSGFASTESVEFDDGGASPSYMPLVFATTKGLGGSTADATYALFKEDNTWSVSCWLKSTASGAVRSVWGRYSGIVGTAGVINATGGMQIFIRSYLGGSDYMWGVSANTLVYDGNWHHLCWTYDGSGTEGGCLGYFDGSAVTYTFSSGGDTGAHSTQVAASGFTLGSRTVTETPQYSWRGKIDEASLWDVELSAAEVSAVYNSGSPTDLNSHSQASNLVHWFRLGELAGDTIEATQPNWALNQIDDASTAVGYTRAIGTTNRADADQTNIVEDGATPGG